MSGSSPSGTPELIALGVIRKAHGVHGEASVEPWTDSVERFDDLGRVFLVSPEEDQRIEVSVLAVRPHAGRVLVTFSGITDPEKVRDLQDWTIEIPRDESRKPAEDEYFVHDLVGLEIIEESTGRRIGRVIEAGEGGGGILLTVQPVQGKRFDIPFAVSICRAIDLEQGRILVDLPEGLEDLESVTPIEEEGGEPVRRARPGPAPLSGQDPAPQSPVEEPADSTPLLRIDVVTIFPSMFDPLLAEGIVARGLKKGVIDVRIWDLRDFATDKHRSTDDEAYGGGHGMVMLAEPVFRCVEAIRAGAGPQAAPRVLMMSPQGRLFGHAVAGELSERGWLAILCGRYEGFDERIREGLVDEEISVGDFVVAGGEVPAMLVIEAVSRLVDGVVGKRNSVEDDSFYRGLLDFPHYTRPAELRGMKVPEVLLSGHAENIRKWRKEQSLRATLEKRPELLERAELDDEAKQMLRRIRENQT